MVHLLNKFSDSEVCGEISHQHPGFMEICTWDYVEFHNTCAYPEHPEVLTGGRAPSVSSPWCSQCPCFPTYAHRHGDLLRQLGHKKIAQGIANKYRADFECLNSLIIRFELTQVVLLCGKIFSLCGKPATHKISHQSIPERIQLQTTPGSQFSCTCVDNWLQVNKSLAKRNRLETPCSHNRTSQTDSRRGVQQLFLSTNLCTGFKRAL